MPLRDNRTGQLIRPGQNVGTSLVIRPDPLSLPPIGGDVQPASTGSPIGKGTLLNLSTDDSESQVVSVTLFNPVNDAIPIGALAGSTLGQARPTALIEWGCGGVQASAEIDFMHGFSFCIPCSFLRVTGINNPIPATIPPTGAGFPALQVGRGRNVLLGAFAGFGSVDRSGSFSNARLTIYDDPPHAFPKVFRIPRFAENLVIIGRDFAAAPPVIDTITVLDEQSSIIAKFSQNIDSPATVFELPNDAYSFSAGVVTAATASARYIFGIAV